VASGGKTFASLGIREHQIEVCASLAEFLLLDDGSLQLDDAEYSGIG
jgi:hypothetical protein